MPNKRSYYPIANLRKRLRRRPSETADAYEEIAYGKGKPECGEIKEALLSARQSSAGILRLAALMDNVAAFYAPRFTDGSGNRHARTSGIRQFLAKDALLKAKYKTLMRYKRLAEQIRRAVGLSLDPYDTTRPIYNLLWGFSPDEPEDDFSGIAQKLRTLYAQLDGMNFKQIFQYLKGDANA